MSGIQSSAKMQPSSYSNPFFRGTKKLPSGKEHLHLVGCILHVCCEQGMLFINAIIKYYQYRNHQVQIMTLSTRYKCQQQHKNKVCPKQNVDPNRSSKIQNSTLHLLPLASETYSRLVVHFRRTRKVWDEVGCSFGDRKDQMTGIEIDISFLLLLSFNSIIFRSMVTKRVGRRFQMPLTSNDFFLFIGQLER